MVHELRALHSVWCVGRFIRIVSEGCACGSRGGHLCVVDIKNISGRYEGVDKGKSWTWKRYKGCGRRRLRASSEFCVDSA